MATHEDSVKVLLADEAVAIVYAFLFKLQEFVGRFDNLKVRDAMREHATVYKNELMDCLVMMERLLIMLLQREGEWIWNRWRKM